MNNASIKYSWCGGLAIELFLFGNQIKQNESNTKVNLMTIRNSRNSIHKGLPNPPSRVINPNNIQHEQNNPQNYGEINPRSQFLLGKIKSSSVLADKAAVVGDRGRPTTLAVSNRSLGGKSRTSGNGCGI